MPIRLTQTATTSRVLPLSRVQPGICRYGCITSDAEQGSESVERVEPPIESESELVEIGLPMLRAHAVVNAVEPSLQITEDEVDDRHELLGHLGVAAFGNGVMVISLLPQATVAAPVVGDVPGITALSTNPPKEPAPRSVAMARRIRPA